MKMVNTKRIRGGNGRDTQMVCRIAGIAAIAVSFGIAVRPAAAQNHYDVTNLVSDGSPASLPAPHTDGHLVNPWGLVASGGSPWWVSDNGTGNFTLYNATGAPQSLIVSIPSPTVGVPGTPTGQVFNGSANFNSDRFIATTEDGTIVAWRPALGTTAAIEVNNSGSGAVYKGIAIDPVGGHLYAANFNAGTIDVFNSAYAPAVGFSFTDPSGIPAGYAPFNIQNIGGTLYVTYALQDGAKHDDVAGVGHGFIDAYHLDGTFAGRIATGTDVGGSLAALNSPWGMAMAPSNFGAFSNDLLVGNFGDGRINVFNPTTDAFLGQLADLGGTPITIDGLWGLAFGNGAAAGPTNDLYFTAGTNGEANGVFGRITTSAPEPGSLALGATGALSLLGTLLRRRRSGAPAA